jgi:hypothetical protein
LFFFAPLREVLLEIAAKELQNDCSRFARNHSSATPSERWDLDLYFFVFVWGEPAE